MSCINSLLDEAETEDQAPDDGQASPLCLTAYPVQQANVTFP